MSAARKTPRGKSRPWVALHTSLLMDTDLLLSGNAARLLYPTLLLHSAEQGLDGRVPSDPRKVNLFAHLDGGVEEVRQALATLVELHKLVADPDGDPAFLYVRSWRRYQADLGGSVTRSASMTTASLRRWHEAGKHDLESKDGCPLCQAGTPGVPADSPAEGTELDVASMRAMRDDFRDCFDEVFARMDRLDSYRFLLAQADELADGNPALGSQARWSLRDEVLADALAYYLPDVVALEQYAACLRGARALSADDGHYWWILAAQATAAVDLHQPAGVVGYLTKVAAGKRAQWLEGQE